MTKEKKGKIDIKCSEFLGWTVHPKDRFIVIPPNSPHSVQPLSTIPAFTEHYDNAAQLLIEWMSKPENGGWRCILHIYKHICCFYTQKKEANADILTDKGVEVTADTLPLAICLCFLRANGIDPSTL